MKYDELKDQGLEVKNLNSRVRLVIRRLKAIEAIDIELYVNALQSSALLCLADMRAQSPYHSFSAVISRQKIDSFNKQLQLLGLSIFCEDVLPIKTDQPQRTDFSFINHKVISEVNKRYKTLHEIGYPIAIDPGNALKLAVAWHIQEFKLASIMEEGVLPKRWLHDWFAPMNIRYGTELGYPGSAITSFLWDTSELRVTLAEMRVDEAQEYGGAWVSFGYTKSVEHNHDIQSTATTWQELIYKCRKLLPTDGLLSQRAISRAVQAISS